MADDRPVDDVPATLSQLRQDFEDFKTTVSVTAARCPTGTIDMTLRSTPVAEALFLQGQTASRDTYKVLWQWVQDNGLVITGLFTVGDGSTTFGLPNMQARFPVGAGTNTDTYAIGTLGGATLKTLLTANMPNHAHTLTIASVGDHDHPGSGALASGSHGGHNSGATPFPPGSGGGAVASNGNTSDGNHNHTLSLAGDGGHTHTGTAAAIGSGTAFDARPMFFPVNFMIWT